MTTTRLTARAKKSGGYEPIQSSLSTSDEQAAISSIRGQLFRDWTRERIRRPRESSRPDAKSRRDAEAPDYLIFGSFEQCDISAAIVHTEVTYVPPEPEPEE